MSFPNFTDDGSGYTPPPPFDPGNTDSIPTQDKPQDAAASFWDRAGADEPATPASFWDDKGSSEPAPAHFDPGNTDAIPTADSGTKKRADAASFWDNAVAPAPTGGPTDQGPAPAIPSEAPPSFNADQPGIADTAGNVRQPQDAASFWDDAVKPAPDDRAGAASGRTYVAPTDYQQWIDDTSGGAGAPFGTQPVTDAQRQATADVPGGDLRTAYGPYGTTDTQRLATQAIVDFNLLNETHQQQVDQFNTKYGIADLKNLMPSLQGEGADNLGQYRAYIDSVGGPQNADPQVVATFRAKAEDIDSRTQQAQDKIRQLVDENGNPVGQYATDIAALDATENQLKAAGAKVDQAGDMLKQEQLSNLANSGGTTDATQRLMDQIGARYGGMNTLANADANIDASLAFQQGAGQFAMANDQFNPMQGPQAPPDYLTVAPPSPDDPVAVENQFRQMYPNMGVYSQLYNPDGSINRTLAADYLQRAQAKLQLDWKDYVVQTPRLWPNPGWGDELAASLATLGVMGYIPNALSRGEGMVTADVNRAVQYGQQGQWGNALGSIASAFASPIQHAPYFLTGTNWGSGWSPNQYAAQNIISANPLGPITPAGWSNLKGGEPGGYTFPVLGGLARAGQFLNTIGKGDVFDPKNWHGTATDPVALREMLDNGVPVADVQRLFRGNVGVQVLWDLFNPGNAIPIPGMGEVFNGIHALSYGRLEGPAAETVGRWLRSANTAESLWNAADEPVLASTVAKLTGGRSADEVGQIMADYRQGGRLPSGLNAPQTTATLDLLERGIDRIAATRGVDRAAATQALFSQTAWDDVLRQFAADSGEQGVNDVEAFVLAHRGDAMDNMIGNIVRNEARLQYGGKGVANLGAVQHASEMAIANKERAIRIQNDVSANLGVPTRGAISDAERAAIIQRFAERPPGLSTAADKLSFLRDTALGSARAGWLALSPKYELANYAGNWFNALYEGALTPTAQLPFLGRAAQDIGRFAPIEYPLRFAGKYGIEPNIGTSFNEAVLASGRTPEGRLVKSGEVPPITTEPPVGQNAFQQARSQFSDQMAQAGQQMGRFGQAINVPRASMGALVKLFKPVAEDQARFALHHVDFHQAMVRRAAEIVANAYDKYGGTPQGRMLVDQLVSYINDGHVHPDEIGAFIRDTGGFKGVAPVREPVVPESGIARGRPSGGASGGRDVGGTGGPRSPRGGEPYFQPPTQTPLDPRVPESVIERFATNMDYFERRGSQNVLDSPLSGAATDAVAKLGIDLPPKPTNADLVAELRARMPGTDLTDMDAATIRSTFGGPADATPAGATGNLGSENAGTNQPPPGGPQTLGDRILANEQAGREHLQQRYGNLGIVATYPTFDDIKAIAAVGAGVLWRGVTNVADWTREMRALFRDDFHANFDDYFHAHTLYQESRQFLRSMADLTRGEIGDLEKQVASGPSVIDAVNRVTPEEQAALGPKATHPAVSDLDSWRKDTAKAIQTFGRSADRTTPEALLAQAQNLAAETRALPEGVGPVQLANLQRQVELFESGKWGATWYDHTEPILRSIFGDDTEKFIEFLAVTSTNADPKTNLKLAMDSYRKWKAGEEIAGGTGTGMMETVGRAAEALRRGGLDIGQWKISSFANNILGNTERVTVDRWMLRALGFHDDAARNWHQYLFAESIYRQLAEQMGVNPRQLQAAVWASIRKELAKTVVVDEPYENILRQFYDEGALDWMKTSTDPVTRKVYQGIGGVDTNAAIRERPLVAMPRNRTSTVMVPGNVLGQAPELREQAIRAATAPPETYPRRGMDTVVQSGREGALAIPPAAGGADTVGPGAVGTSLEDPSFFAPPSKAGLPDFYGKLGLARNSDKTVTLYYPTTLEEAARVADERVIRSQTPVSLTSDPNGAGRGETVLAVKVKPSDLTRTATHADGSMDYELATPGGSAAVRLDPHAGGQYSALSRLSEALGQGKAAALERVKGRQVLGITYRFDPKVVGQDIRDYAQWGALTLAKTAVDFAEWSRQMVNRFTDPVRRTPQQIEHFNTNVRPNLRPLYDEASRVVQNRDIIPNSRTLNQIANDEAARTPAQNINRVIGTPEMTSTLLDTLKGMGDTMAQPDYVKRLASYGSALGRITKTEADPARLAALADFRRQLAEMRVAIDPNYNTALARELRAGTRTPASEAYPLPQRAGGPQPRQIGRPLGDIPANDLAARSRDAALEHQYRVAEFNRLFQPESGAITDFGAPARVGTASTGSAREAAAVARMYRDAAGAREAPGYRGAVPPARPDYAAANNLPWDLRFLGAGPEPPLQIPGRVNVPPAGITQTAGPLGGTMFPAPEGPVAGPRYPTFNQGARLGGEGPGAVSFGAYGGPPLVEHGPATDLMAGAASKIDPDIVGRSVARRDAFAQNWLNQANWQANPDWQSTVSDMLATIPNQWRQAVAHSNADAFMNSAKVFNNYGLQLRGLNRTLGALSPFFQYQIKTPLYWASVAARNPGLVYGISKATQDVRQANAEDGLTKRNAALNKVYLGGKWGVDLRDLVPLTRMYDALFNPTNISDEGAVMRQDPISQRVRDYLESGVSFGMWPWASAALQAAGVTHPPLANMTEPPATNWLGNAAEAVGLPRQVGSFVGSVLNPGDSGEQAFRAGLGKLAPLEGRLPPEAQNWLQSTFPNGLKENDGIGQYYAGWFLRQMVDQGVTDEQSAKHAATYHEGPVWQEAMSRVQQWSQDGYNASMFFPGRVGQLLPGEAEGRKPVYPDTNPGPFFYQRGAGEGGKDAGVRYPVKDENGDQVIKDGTPQYYAPQPGAPANALDVLYDRTIPDYADEKQAAARYLRDNNVGIADKEMNGLPSEHATEVAQRKRDNAINYVLEHNAPTGFGYNRRAGEGGTDAGTGEISAAGNYYIQSPDDEQYSTAKAQLNPTLLTYGTATTSDYARDYLKGQGAPDVENQGVPSEQRTTAANQRFQAQQVESDIGTGRFLNDPAMRNKYIDYKMAQDAYEGVPMTDPGTGQTVLVKDFLQTSGYYGLLDQAAQARDSGDTGALARIQGRLDQIAAVPQVADYLNATKTAAARDQMPQINLARDNALLNPDTQAALAPLARPFEFIGADGERIQTHGQTFDPRDQSSFGVRRDRILYEQLTPAERNAYQAWEDWKASPDGQRYADIQTQQRAAGDFGSPGEKAWFKAHEADVVAATNARNAAIRDITNRTGENPVAASNKVGGGLYPDFQPSTVAPKDLTVYPSSGGGGGGSSRYSTTRRTSSAGSATAQAIAARTTFFGEFDTLSKQEKAAAYNVSGLDSALAKGARLSAGEWGKALDTLRQELPNIRGGQAAQTAFYQFYDSLSTSEKSAIRDLMSFDRKTATADDWRRTLQNAQDRLRGGVYDGQGNTGGRGFTTRGGAPTAFYDQYSSTRPDAGIPVALLERYGAAGAKKIMAIQAAQQRGRGVAAR